MSGFFFLTLAAALLAGSDSATLSGTGMYGAKWSVLPGKQISVCNTHDCDIGSVRRKTLAECGLSCANRPGCRCAIYSPSDLVCAWKKYQCSSQVIGLQIDPSSSHYAVDVQRRVPGPSPPKPAPTPAPKPAPVPSPIPLGRDGGSAGNPTGEVHRSTMTIFQGFGIPYGGCGVPMDKTVDDDGKMLPYVALNVHTGNGNLQGLFDKGNNCGRWLKITLGKPCGGNNAGEDIPGCLANFNSGPSDSKEGEVVYGYVSDSCADTNNWCTTDRFHVDMGKENMQRLGLADNWQNNRIEWSFLDGPPPGWKQTSGVKYYWAIDAKMEWPCIITAGLTNGISRVETLFEDGSWKPAWKVWILGQQWTLPTYDNNSNVAVKLTNGKFTVRTFDVDGNSYGEEMLNPPTLSSTVIPAN